METTKRNQAEVRYYRLAQIIGNQKAKPPIQPIFPFGRSKWYAGIQSGIFPKPVHVGRTALWRGSEIDALKERIDRGELAI